MVNKTGQQSQHARVKHEVGLRIIRGVYPSGDLLPHEQDLIATLGVSRSVLREAMRTLAAKGLVEPKKRVGTRVTERDRWNLLDDDVIAWHAKAPERRKDMLRQVVEARRMIEPSAAMLAAKRRDPGGIQAVSDAMQGMIEAGTDLQAYLNADIEFHRSIYRACGNELIGQMGEILLGALRISHAVSSRVPKPIERSLPLHKSVANAIVRGSATTAYRAMTRLIESATEDLRATLGLDTTGAKP
ncbi:MAG: FadR family transcriptional regulator [Gammaproteobacteria bacterium]|nr:MAG: FadR family transcriptional regulator [Gammaproteobacteria bacterium]